MLKEETNSDEEMIQSMLSNNKIEMLYDAVGQIVIPPPQQAQKKKKKLGGSATSRRAVVEDTKTVHNIFDEYLGEEYLAKLRLDYQEIYEIFAERAKPFLDDLEEDKPIILEIIDAFVQRMVLSLIVQDKVAFKVRTDMVDRIESLYDHRNGKPVNGVKNNFANYDEVNDMINRRCREALDQSTDEIYARFSEPKKRGRHPKQRPEEVINEVESIAGEYIAKRLSLTQAAAALAASNTGPSAIVSSNGTGIDYYPIFTQTLAVYEKCIPKQNNHGFYVQRLMQMIRYLDSGIWPLHGLMSMLNNLNYCVHADTVKMSFDRSKRRFYCCYSGLEIYDAEIVTCIRVVENDAVRLKEWRENPMLISKPFEAKEFTRSVGAFYMKKELCCANTLIFMPFSEGYKAHFPEYFNPTPIKPVCLVKKKQPKRKADDAPLSTKKTKKPRVKVEPETECLFESLSIHATKRPQETTWRAYMACLCQNERDSESIWYRYKEKLYCRNLKEVQDTVWPILQAITKKSYLRDMYTIIASSLLTDEIQHIEACYGVVLDFTEALLMPEKTISSYAMTQTTPTIKALLYATRQHAKERGTQSNPLLMLKTTEEISSCFWFHNCPLLFMALFEYLAYYEEPAAFLKSSIQTQPTLTYSTLLSQLDLSLIQ